MRVGKQRQHRKAVKFYTACFRFRPSFKILCDGTFVHHLVTNKISPEKALSTILSDTVKIFTRRCDHDGRKKADSCIFEMVGENDPDHFFIASHDMDMRKRLHEVPGVPLIFGLINSLFLEKPFEAQRGFVKRFEEKHLHMTVAEKTLMKKRSSRILGVQEQKDSNSAMEEHRDNGLGTSTSIKQNVVKKESVVKDRPQFKRRKDNKDKADTTRSRSRTRKRSRKGKNPPHTEAEIA